MSAINQQIDLVRSYYDIGGVPLVVKAIASKVQTTTIGYSDKGGELEVSFSGQKYLVSTEYPSAERWVKTERGVHEPAAKRILRTKVSTGDCFLDIGAQCGDTALFVHSIVGDNGSIHAFEATRYWYNILEQNIRMNEINNIQTHNVAVGAERGSLSPRKVVGGRHELMEKTLNQHEISVNTIDDYVTEKDIAPDLIQIDVDGAEYQVLRGGKNTVEQTPTILELHHTGLLDEWEETVRLSLEISNVYYLSGQGLTPNRHPFMTHITSENMLNDSEVSFLYLEA